MSLNNVKVVKKDGTKEEFNVQKVVVAVNKSAYRALIKFSQKDIDFICHFVEEKVEELGVHEIRIPEMHNIVEGALEKVNPIVAKSYRDYRNYKQDFVQMLDEVTLLGRDGEEEITLEELDKLSGRFPYEFVCDIGKRVPRVYVNEKH